MESVLVTPTYNQYKKFHKEENAKKHTERLAKSKVNEDANLLKGQKESLLGLELLLLGLPVVADKQININTKSDYDAKQAGIKQIEDDLKSIEAGTLPASG